MQVPLNPEKKDEIKKILPHINDNIINEMEKAPKRRFDETICQEPHVYRLMEAVQHNGEALKMIVRKKITQNQKQITYFAFVYFFVNVL